MNYLLDMDGVLAQFDSAVFELLNKYTGKNVTVSQYAKEYGQWDMPKYFGITPEEFDLVIESKTAFWYNIEPYPWASDLVDLLRQHGDVTIVTAPSLDPACAYEKLEWLRDKMNISSKDVFIGAKKELMAGNGILIDDGAHNVEAFQKAGGRAVLVPSSWNTHPFTFNTVINTLVENEIFKG